MIHTVHTREVVPQPSTRDEQVTAFAQLAQKAPSDTIQAAINLLNVVVSDEVRAPFVTRALHALTHLAKESSRRSQLAAVSASSDFTVLLRVLETSDALAKLGADDPLTVARIRGLLAQQRLLSDEGGACSGEELGQLLGGLSRQAIDKRRRTGKLIALNLGRHGFRYPVWQINRGLVLPGLDRVIAALDACDSWTQVSFMLSPNSWLGSETPLAALRRGEADRVVAAAEMFAQ